MLRLPSPTQYIIYDPLTARPDPANPNRVDSHAVSEQRHSARSHIQPGRLVQEQAVRALCGRGAGAESELRRAGAAADRQLLPGRRAKHSREPTVRRAPRLQPVGDPTASSSAAAAASIIEDVDDWTYESPAPEFRGLHDSDRDPLHVVLHGQLDAHVRRSTVHRHTVVGQQVLHSSTSSRS